MFRAPRDTLTLLKFFTPLPLTNLLPEFVKPAFHSLAVGVQSVFRDALWKQLPGNHTSELCECSTETQQTDCLIVFRAGWSRNTADKSLQDQHMTNVFQSLCILCLYLMYFSDFTNIWPYMKQLLKITVIRLCTFE